jgi:menaquinone-dependent protoporphyrinogen oxidase
VEKIEMKNVLVVVASKHGSTREIGETIADELRTIGITAICQAVDEVDDLTAFDGIVLGSAVYMGHWLDEAVTFVADREASLSAVPVWLFSSGPLCVEGTAPVDVPSPVRDLMRTIGAKEHRSFSGKLDKDHLRLAERLVTSVVQAPVGDFRDWATIRRWARAIGRVRVDRSRVRSRRPMIATNLQHRQASCYGSDMATTLR